MRWVFLTFVLTILLAGTIAYSQQASAQTPMISATHSTSEPGDSGSITVSAVDIDSPGLGAWTIDIGFDDDVIEVLSCDAMALPGKCNPDFAPGVVRSAGATAIGHTGDTVLVELNYRCLSEEGSTSIDIMPVDVSDATVGGPVLMSGLVTSNGTVTCEAEAGGGLDDDDDGDRDGDGAPTPTPVSGALGSGRGAGPSSLPVAGIGSSSGSTWITLAAVLTMVSLGALGGASMRRGGRAATRSAR